MARTVDAIAGMVDEARQRRRRGDRSGRDRRAADRLEQRRARRRRARATGVEIEVISGEEESRLAYVAVDLGARRSASGTLVVFDTGGGSSQFTFGRGREVDERFSVNVGAVRFTERFGLDGAVVGGRRRRGAAQRSPPTCRGSTAGRRPTCSSGWAARSRTWPRSSHGLVTYDPDVVQGTVLDARRDRPPDRALPHADRRPAARDPGPAAEARRGDPGRRLHRPDRAREARPGLAHGQRPRAPPRRAGRAVRRVAPQDAGRASDWRRSHSVRSSRARSSRPSSSSRASRSCARRASAWRSSSAMSAIGLRGSAFSLRAAARSSALPPQSRTHGPPRRSARAGRPRRVPLGQHLAEPVGKIGIERLPRTRSLPKEAPSRSVAVRTSAARRLTGAKLCVGSGTAYTCWTITVLGDQRPSRRRRSRPRSSPSGRSAV